MTAVSCHRFRYLPGFPVLTASLVSPAARRLLFPDVSPHETHPSFPRFPGRTGQRPGRRAARRPHRHRPALASLRKADSESISFLVRAQQREAAHASHAVAYIVSPKLVDDLPADANLLIDADPYGAYARLAQWFDAQVNPRPAGGIAPGAHVHPDATVAATAVIETGAVIGAHAVIGDQAGSAPIPWWAPAPTWRPYPAARQRLAG